MAVKIRLRRVGAKKQPAYRIVIADARAPRDGRFIEIIGHYNPLTEPSDVVINNERALHWLRSGAQPTESVQRMLVKTGVWSEYTGEPMPELPAKPEPKVEETPAPAAEEAPAEEAVVEAAPVEETPLVEAVEGEPTEAQAETEEKSAESEEQA
ncbi:MAG: 30S ribosomal protein S16 [Armatimonadota bacterium]